MESIIQVAGVKDIFEAEMLAGCGVTHIGLPLGPGVREQDMSLADAATMVAGMKAGRADQPVFVLITYLAEPGEVIQLCDRVGADAVQLHGEVTPAQVAALRAAAPGLFLIKSLVVGEGVDVVGEAVAHAPHVDAFLTDTFDASSGARGATGKVHDWATDAAIVRSVERPVILAGGLNPDNVAAALRATGAAGVDAHTGLENALGRKDQELVRRFVEAARLALIPVAG